MSSWFHTKKIMFVDISKGILHFNDVERLGFNPKMASYE